MNKVLSFTRDSSIQMGNTIILWMHMLNPKLKHHACSYSFNTVHSIVHYFLPHKYGVPLLGFRIYNYNSNMNESYKETHKHNHYSFTMPNQTQEG